MNEKEQKAKDKLKKFSDNHPLRKEQDRIIALEAIVEAVHIWIEGGYSDTNLHEVFNKNADAAGLDRGFEE